MKKNPFYIKSTVILLGLSLLVFILFSLQDILIPLAFSLLLAILLNPLVSRLERWKIKNIYAIVIALLIAFIAFIALMYFISSQIIVFGNDLPTLKKKFSILFSGFQQWTQSSLNIPVQKQNEWIHKGEQSLSPLLGKFLGTMLGVSTILFLIPVYTFLFLFYKKLILNFLYEVFAEKNSREVNVILKQTKTSVQKYMIGLVVEGIIVAAMNSTALLIIGVKYALLIGVIGAILNVLPYIGGIIAIALPVIVATITKDGIHAQIAIVIAYLVIQFIDNQFLLPWVVSSRVQLNALFSIIVIWLAGALWGISGMFLAVPFFGVMKIIFDRIDELKPWGKLMGDEIPTRHKGEIWNNARKRILLAKQTTK